MGTRRTASDHAMAAVLFRFRERIKRTRAKVRSSTRMVTKVVAVDQNMGSGVRGQPFNEAREEVIELAVITGNRQSVF
jgi:hypothetical protein